MTQDETDAHWMRQALELAARAQGNCPPNPAVGCVLIAADGRLIGGGYTQPVGQAHAEVMALRDAAAHGEDVHGATAYVTLEPCAHQGHTGPCADALIAAGVARVVAALRDPNPRVAGGGFARLRAAGVALTVGPEAAAARALNVGFLHRMETGLPWVRVKTACSLDGRTALANGVSQWITSDAARADVQRWRARSGAVLTGIGTVLADNPLLNVRLVDVHRQPLLAIVDSHLRTPVDAALWNVAGRQVVIYAAEEGVDPRAALEARGASVVIAPGIDGRVDLPAVVRDLAAREVNEVHVEAGARLAGGLLTAGAADELLVYQAPVLLGAGRALADLPPLSQLADGCWLDLQTVERVGPDLRMQFTRRSAA